MFTCINKELGLMLEVKRDSFDLISLELTKESALFKPEVDFWIKSKLEEIDYKGVLGKIIYDILEHANNYPDHGVGCICMDEHSQTIKTLIHKTKLDENEKAFRNFKTILSYLLR